MAFRDVQLEKSFVWKDFATQGIRADVRMMFRVMRVECV